MLEHRINRPQLRRCDQGNYSASRVGHRTAPTSHHVVIHLTMLRLLLLAGILASGCSKPTDSLKDSAAREAKVNSSIEEQQLVGDLNALESMEVTVCQPADVSIRDDGATQITSSKEWRSSNLDAKARASAYRLLREYVAKYPLQPSFRSIQERYLIAPEYWISFSKIRNGTPERVFKIDLYIALVTDLGPEARVEIKHQKIGRAIRLEGEMGCRLFAFFAQCIAADKPETARALRKIADRGDSTHDWERIKRSEKAH